MNGLVAVSAVFTLLVFKLRIVDKTDGNPTPPPVPVIKYFRTLGYKYVVVDCSLKSLLNFFSA
jgi:hypothetical protein